jgi:hypothetical protein
MPWTNNDGLRVKFGPEESAVARGGARVDATGMHEISFEIDYRDVLSATAAILGSVAAGDIVGSYGVMVPKGLLVKEVEIQTITAPTSSGTVASATLVLGFIGDDLSTTYDVDGLTTTSMVIGTVLETAGEVNVIRVGSTGAGALVGTTLANDGVIVVANSAHGSNPFTAGKWRVTVRGFYPTV